jgi:hypothetical protein
MSLRVTAAFGETVTTQAIAVARFDDPAITWDGPLSFFDSTGLATTIITGLPAVVTAQVRTS